MNTFALSLFHRSQAASIGAACALVLCAGIARAQFTTTWTGGAATGDWSTAGNWNNGAPTTSGTWALTFAGTTQTTSTNTIGGTSDTITLSSLSFTNTQPMTLSAAGSRTLTLVNNSAFTMTGAIASGSSNVVTIPIVLLGSSTFSTDNSARILRVDGAVSGTGSMAVTGGYVYLNNNSNSFSGGFTITGGNVGIGQNGVFGSSPLTINAGSLEARGGSKTVSNSGTITGSFRVGSANALTLGGSFNLAGGTRTITTDGATTMSGVISNGALTKAGGAILILSGSNTYAGNTTINTGTLQIGSGGATGALNTASAISGSSGATLAFNRSNAVTQGTDFSSVIGGSIGVAQVGSGTLVLNGVNTYSGTTSINAGTLQIGSGSTAGSLSTSSVITGSAGGTLAFNRSNTVAQGTDFNSVIGGGINVSQFGSGTLSLTGTNTYTGTTSISNGTLEIGGAGVLGSGSYSAPIAVASGGTLSVASSANQILSGAVSGGGSLTKSNAGVLTLSAANTYTGPTTVAAGLLVTSTNDRIADGSSIVMTGGTLQFGGSDTVAALSGTAGTIDFGISRLTSSVTTSSTFSGSLVGNRPASAGQGASGFQKSGSGTLTLAGNVSLSVDNSIAQGFNNPLQVNAGELILAGTTMLTNVEVRYGSSGNPTLRITSGSHSFNAGAGSSIGSVALQNGSFVVDNGFAAVRGMSIGFGGVAGATNVLTINGGTLSSPAANIALGNNTVATQTPTLNLNGGVLETNGISNGGSGTNSITFNGGTLRMLGTSMIASGTNPGGNLLALNVGNGGAILDTGTFANTISQGFVGVGSGGLAKLGSAQLTLSGTSTYTGATTLTSGTLRAGAAAGGQAFGNLSAVSLANAAGVTLDLNGFSQTIGSLAGGGASGGTVSLGGGTLTAGGDNASTSFAGVISGNGGLTKSGTGVLTLSGANTYSGLTTVSAGVLATTADSRIPSASSIVMAGGTLQFGGNNTVGAISGTGGTIDVGISRLTSSMTTSSTFSGSLVGNRPASAGQGASGFQKSGSGTLTLAGNFSLSVDSSIAQGFNNPLQVNAGELVLAGTTTLTNVENRISGSGAVQRITSGSHSLNSVNIQNGTFIVDNGFATVQSMSVGFGAAAGATNVVTINGGTLSSPTGGITLGNNTGATQTPTLNLNGGVLETNSIPNGGSGTNSITFNGGTLRMLGTSVIPSNANPGGNLLALNVGNGGAILDTGTFANTISQGFAGVGSGGLTKLGSAQLTLAGTSTYTGATTISAGTLAFDRIAALGSTSGVGIASGAGLTYTGTTGALDRVITVTGGTGTVRNSGGGTLTLGGTLTKDGTVLRLTGGAFNVTGQIVGQSPNSDLLVDGTSTVMLSTVNTYNGPTFVNQASNLIVGVNDAIPSGSLVTLGDATTMGTLTLGSNVNAIGGLAFGVGGGTLRIAASATGATAQLTATSGTINLSGGTLDLTGSGTSAGYYRLLSAQSITNSFTNITGTTGAYQILTTSTSIDYQQRAVLGAVSVTNPVVSIITGGSAAFTYTVANNALTGGAGLTFTGTGFSGVAGSSLGSVNAGDTSGAIAGFVFTGTSIGSGQQGTFTVSAPSAFGTTTATGTVSMNVLNHSLASFQASDTPTLSLTLGTYDTNSSMWTSGSGSLGFSVWNVASGGFTDADTAGLALYDVVFTSGDNVFSTGLTNFANLASGTFNGFMASVLSPGSLTEGTYQGVYTLKFRDQQNLSGAANTRDLTLTANVIVVPEPGAILLAGIGVAAAAWTLRRKK